MPPVVGVERYGPGEEVSNPRPGDFILVRCPDWVGRVITWGQRWRARDPAGRRYAHWSHAALVVSSAGHIVDVGPRGVRVKHLGRYRSVEYHYARIAGTVRERLAAVGYARACVGQGYARLGFLALGLAALVGARWAPASARRHNCVSLVAGALGRAGESFDREPDRMTPADLARHYGITP